MPGFGGGPLSPLPLGGGGPLTVVRALAVAGQVVRIVFSEEPLHRSPAGGSDALNPSNYVFTIAAGQATAPTPVGVDRDPIIGPTRGVGNGGATDEVGIDVHVDLPLIAGIAYQVAVRNIVATAGGILSAPTTAGFSGVTLLEETGLPARNQDLIDIANPAFVGHYLIDDSGDVATEDPDDGTRKRIYRRLTTRKGAFRTLPNYGSTIDLKDLGSIAKISAAQTDLTLQVKQEPDVVAASVQITMQATGITIITTRAKTVRGNFIDVGAKVSLLGAITQL